MCERCTCAVGGKRKGVHRKALRKNRFRFAVFLPPSFFRRETARGNTQCYDNQPLRLECKSIYHVTRSTTSSSFAVYGSSTTEVRKAAEPKKTVATKFGW